MHDACPAAGHLRAFEAAGVGRVHVVVHPAVDAIDAFIAPWRDRLALDLVVNDHAEDRNNWYSLLLGFDAWATSGGDDVVVVNSDLFADASWFTGLLGAITSCRQPAALAVDPTRGRTDEAMKVALDVDGDHVTAIGKVGIAAPGGEYVGLAWWSRSSALELRDVLAGFVAEPGRVDHWYEHGIQCHLDAGGRYAAVPVPSDHWVEIDDEADLEAARRLPVRG